MKLLKASGVSLFIFLMLVSLAQAVQIGPTPTSTGLNTNGSFTVGTATALASGFGGGTIYYPVSTAQKYGVIVVCPGYTGTSSSISWFARRLATHGFVTLAMNTYTIYDQPASRATQMASALRYMVNSSSVRSRINSSYQGVAGHSMGGGGTLIACKNNSSLKVGIPMTPWAMGVSFSSVRVPQMIFGADGDTIAPYAVHALPFYNAIPSSTPKAFGLLIAATHFTPNITDQRIGRYGVAFAKRFMYDDERYQSFLCGAYHTAYKTGKFTSYLSNCSVY